MRRGLAWRALRGPGLGASSAPRSQAAMSGKGPTTWAAATILDGRKLKAEETGVLALVPTHPLTSLGLDHKVLLLPVLLLLFLFPLLIFLLLLSLASTIHSIYHLPVDV